MKVIAIWNYKNMNKKSLGVIIGCLFTSQLVYADQTTASPISSTVSTTQSVASAVPETDANKKIEVQNKINNILHKKVFLKVTTPEEYIANLDTTNFVKGLLLESVVLSNTIAESRNNDDKLESIAQDVINNTACQQVIMKEEALVHYQRLMNLLFTTSEQRNNFLEGQQNLEKHVQNIKFDPDFIDYCKQQTY